MLNLEEKVLTIVSCARHVALFNLPKCTVAPALTRWWCCMSGKWRLPRGGSTGQSPLHVRQHSRGHQSSFKKQLHNHSTPNCPPYTHVEPTIRRLGGRFGVAILSCRWKEYPVYCRLRALVLVYVPIVMELSRSFANDAQLSSLALSSA